MIEAHQLAQQLYTLLVSQPSSLPVESLQSSLKTFLDQLPDIQSRDYYQTITNEEVFSALEQSDVKPRTYKEYYKHYERLQRVMNVPDNMAFLYEPATVLEAIQEVKEWSCSTKQLVINAILKITKLFYFPPEIEREYLEAVAAYSEETNRRMQENQPRGKVLDWEALCASYHEHFSTLEPKEQLIAALYIERPPLRTEYTREVYIIPLAHREGTDDRYKNRIFYDERTNEVILELRDFKNVDKMGAYEYVFPERRVKKLVIQQIKERGFYKTFLPYTAKRLQGMIREILKKLGHDGTLQSLRRAYETYIQMHPSYQAQTLGERMAEHRDVLHSIGTAQIYRLMT